MLKQKWDKRYILCTWLRVSQNEASCSRIDLSVGKDEKGQNLDRDVLLNLVEFLNS